jgi:plasmid stability protein
MPTLYVENVPEELYEALRTRAHASRKSIAAEVIELLQQNVPTAAELGRRKQFLKLVTKISRQKPAGRGPFPGTEEMLREDRGR